MTNEEMLGQLIQSQQKTDEQLNRLFERMDASQQKMDAFIEHTGGLMVTLTDAVVHMDRVVTELVKAITTQRANGKAKE